MEHLEESKKFFEKNGFVLLKNILSEEDSKFIVENANELEKWKETPNEWMIYYDKSNGNRIKTRLENFLNYNIKLKQYLNESIYPILKYITNKDLNLFKEKLNWKVGKGKGFLAHQDHPAWIDFEPDRYYSISLFANNCTKENGCLQFVKGGMNKKIYEYEKEGTGKLKQEQDFEWDYITTTPRDILIFDSYVPHRSFDNTTDNPRRIFYFTYNESKYGDLYNKYLVKKRIEFPPDIERDNTKTYNIMNNKYNLANPIR